VTLFNLCCYIADVRNVRDGALQRTKVDSGASCTFWNGSASTTGRGRPAPSQRYVRLAVVAPVCRTSTAVPRYHNASTVPVAQGCGCVGLLASATGEHVPCGRRSTEPKLLHSHHVGACTVVFLCACHFN
jgi:hypothetical protein